MVLFEHNWGPCNHSPHKYCKILPVLPKKLTKENNAHVLVVRKSLMERK